MKIGIVYGHITSNLGDVAINHGTAAMLRRVAPEAHVHVVLLKVSDDSLPVAKAAFEGIENVSFCILRTRHKTAAGVSGSLSELELAAKYVLEPGLFIEDAGLTGCDIVLYNSGEQVFAYDDHGSHVKLIWRVLPALAAKASGMRFVVLPATVGPFESPSLEPMLRAFFTLNDDMAVRDTVSAQMAAEFMGADPPPVLLDPAFFTPVPKQEERDADPTLALVMRLERFGLRYGTYYHTRNQSMACAQEGFDASPSHRFAVAAARAFIEQVGGRVKLLVQARLSDGDLTSAIADTLREEGYGDKIHLVQPASVTEYQSTLATTDLVVASRYHACILGLVAGRPVMGVYFDEHGHKMPGLFDMLEMPDHCVSLSRRAPESVAESVASLFLDGRQAFADMPERLLAKQQETLAWLQQALEGKGTRRTDEVTAASLAYVSGIEAVRARTVRDALSEHTEYLKAERDALATKLAAAQKEVATLKAGMAKERQAVQAVRNSVSFKLGNMMVDAVRKPGRNTVFLPYRALRLAGRARRTRTKRSGLDVTASKATTSEAGRPGIGAGGGETERSTKRAGLTVPAEYSPNRNRVFYLLNNSLPYATGGYAIRTHGLLKSLTADGWDMYGMTRLGFPFDVNIQRGLNVPEVTAGQAIPDTESIDGVRYCRILDGQMNLLTLPTDDYLHRYQENLLSLCAKHRPALIHGASNFRNGIAATETARILGLPSIYEVRGLWEMTRASVEPGFVNTKRYRDAVRREMDACSKATAVIAITHGVRELLVERGVPGRKIVVVPNGVDTDTFVPIPRDSDLEARLGYAGRTVIGYVGAFAVYEGLDYLLRAVAMLLRHGRNDFRVLLVGDGPKYDELQALCDELHLRDVVTIVGRVPHHEVERYYSLIDVVPLPRIGAQVCEITSPLKPFEAMAMGKVVVASDVAALAEIVHDGETGLLHRKDDVEHLAHVMLTVLDTPELTQRLGEAARKWVVANRDWRMLAGVVGDLYRELIGNER